MDYVGSSLYAPCVLAAKRIYKPEQFLFLRYEDLSRMQAPALVRLIAKFTGLYTDDGIVSQLVDTNKCNAASSTSHPQSQTNHGLEDQLEMGAQRHAEFFAAYDGLLDEVVGQNFHQWGTAQVRKLI